jgi:hypothetical protein
MVPKELEGHAFASFCFRIRPFTDRVTSEYLLAVLHSTVGFKQVWRSITYATVRPNTTKPYVQAIRIPLYSRTVQERIAQRMQDAYAARHAKLAEAEQVLMGIEGYVFTELSLDETKLQSCRTALKPISAIVGGRFDFEAVVTSAAVHFNHTDPMALSEVVELVNDRVMPAEEFLGKDVNYIGLANIASQTGELAEFSPVKGESILSSSVSFKQGDILFGRMRPYLNKVWVAEFDGICSGEALVLRPDSCRVDTVFLHALLLSRLTLSQVIPLQSGTSLPRVVASDVLSINLPIPANMEQQARIGAEVLRRRIRTKQLRSEAEAVTVEAKAHVESMILGEESLP